MYPAGLYGSGKLTPVLLRVTTEIPSRREEADRSRWLTAWQREKRPETTTEPGVAVCEAVNKRTMMVALCQPVCTHDRRR